MPSCFLRIVHFDFVAPNKHRVQFIYFFILFADIAWKKKTFTVFRKWFRALFTRTNKARINCQAPPGSQGAHLEVVLGKNAMEIA